MAKIFCVANQKGGVGKTTTTVNLAAGLARVGQRVLMVDLDPQGNATMGSGVDKRAMKLSVYDVLLESATVNEAVLVPPPATTIEFAPPERVSEPMVSAEAPVERP